MSGYERVWRRFEDNEITHSAAHYLLAISGLTSGGNRPRAADIARALEVSRAAVSLQLKVLREHGLVDVGSDHRVRLTEVGQDVVSRVASKRFVVRAFLEQVLHIESDIAESDACKIEHLISEDTGAALARFLRYVQSSDPRGQELIAAFTEATASCPPGVRCEFCTRRCLIETLASP